MLTLKKNTKKITKQLQKPIKHAANIYKKWKQQIILLDKILFLISVVLLGLFKSNFLMVGIYLLLYPYIILTGRKKTLFHLFVSSGIALLWMLFANKWYGYNSSKWMFFGLNSYPLFAWASGLFIAYIIYSHLENRILTKRFLKRFSIFSILYWLLLLFSETTAYHLFNIKNLVTSTYAGLPICNCIHAPPWMQVSYFLLGPLYFIVCELLGLETMKRKTRKIKQKNN